MLWVVKTKCICSLAKLFLELLNQSPGLLQRMEAAQVSSDDLSAGHGVLWTPGQNWPSTATGSKLWTRNQQRAWERSRSPFTSHARDHPWIEIGVMIYHLYTTPCFGLTTALYLDHVMTPEQVPFAEGHGVWLNDPGIIIVIWLPKRRTFQK